MTTFDYPANLAPAAVPMFDFAPQTNSFEDGRSGKSLRQIRSNPRWLVQFSWANLAPVKWKALMALRARLEGSVSCVRLYDFSDQCSSGLSGNDFFDDDFSFDDDFGFDESQGTIYTAAAIGATSVALQTTILSGVAVFKAGDKIGLPNDRLYLITDDADTTADGIAHVLIKPALLEAIAAGNAWTVRRPTGRFYMATAAEPFPRNLNNVADVSISFIEEVRP